VRHADLQALHVLMRRRSDAALEAVLIDCDSVRFEGPPSDAERVRDLAHLNASLPDGFASTAQRRDAFEAYARRCPFAGSRESVLREIASVSLARAQHWTGAGCACVEASRDARRESAGDQGAA
jgi:Ser/Thr protein kinase RdoA (MazF antagonist)